AAQSGTLRLGAVQGNVSQPGLGAFVNVREVLNNHARGTHELAEQVGQGNLDLVVWPENGTDVNPRADSAAAEVVDNAAQAAGAPILLGTDRYGTDTEATVPGSTRWCAGSPVRGRSSPTPSRSRRLLPSTSPCGRWHGCSPLRWTWCRWTWHRARKKPWCR